VKAHSAAAKGRVPLAIATTFFLAERHDFDATYFVRDISAPAIYGSNVRIFLFLFSHVKLARLILIFEGDGENVKGVSFVNMLLTFRLAYSVYLLSRMLPLYRHVSQKYIMYDIACTLKKHLVVRTLSLFYWRFAFL